MRFEPINYQVRFLITATKTGHGVHSSWRPHITALFHHTPSPPALSLSSQTWDGGEESLGGGGTQRAEAGGERGKDGRREGKKEKGETQRERRTDRQINRLTETD